MMNEKKNIDRLFQEKFKDFEVTPDSSVWEKIREKQAKDDKKRGIIIPFWFRIAGVAAVVALIFSVGSLWISEDINQPIVDTIDMPSEQKIPKKKYEKNVLVEKTTEDTGSFKDLTDARSTDSLQNTKKPFVKVSDKNAIQLTSISDKKAVSEKNKIRKNDYNKETHTTEIIKSVAKEEKIALQRKNEPKSFNDSSDHTSFDTERTTNNKNSVNSGSQAIVGKDEEKKEPANKKSIFDAIEENEALQETEIAVNSTKRWDVAPTVAPVYYNAIGNGSSVDSQFIDNDRQGQVNMSYGVQIAYTINKRFTVRSGVNSVNLGYGTENIGFSASSSAQSLDNVAYNTNSQSLEVVDYNPASASPASLVSETSDATKISTPQNRGVLNLSMNYIEIPMEMKYAIIDKKIGVNIIGGVSTLFLQNNQLSIDAGNFTTKVGETTNLNPVSFSSNLGIGFDYQLSKTFQIQLEPIMKYQINAYENTSGNFNPYYLGIYTGISYRF